MEMTHVLRGNGAHDELPANCASCTAMLAALTHSLEAFDVRAILQM